MSEHALSRRAYLQFVVVLGALISLGPLTIDMYLPAFPRITEELAATQAQVQLTLTGMLVGLAVGQLVIGPLSDAFGRRRPLMVGLVVHAAASLLCSVATSVEMLAAVRIIQGFAGAAISVTAMAMVRDRFSGIEMARLMARLILVIGLAPIIAPSLGGVVLAWSGWRTIFVILACAAVALIVLGYVGLAESLPPERRQPARLGASLGAYRRLLGNPRFMALAVLGGAMMATLFAYVSGASFLLQGDYGMSERAFAIVFGCNAAGFVIGSQLNPVLLRRHSLVQVISAGILVTLGGAVALLVAGLVHSGLIGVLIPLAVVMGCAGITMPNIPALAMEDQAGAAGTAAALLGCLQFGVGAVAAPMVGTLGGGAVAMGSVMLTLALLAVALMFGVIRRPAVR